MNDTRRPRERVTDGVVRPVSPVFRLMVDEAGLTTALHAFVTDPRPTRNDQPVILDLHEFAPGMVPVLEAMVLDGVQEWTDVAAYVRAVLAGPAGWRQSED